MNVLDTIRYFVERIEFIVLPFALCTTAIFLFQTIAKDIGVMDKPTVRKMHEGNIPMIGGFAVFFAFSVSSITFLLDSNTIYFLTLSGVLLMLGYLDDVFDLSPLLRILVQAAVAVSMAVLAGIQIEHLGDLFGTGPIVLGTTLSIIFTVVCTIGVINSVNMIDGVDGLAVSLLSVSFLALALVAWHSGDLHTAKKLVILLGALAAVLLFNARLLIKKAKIFLGDSGSVFLGFTLCWFFIYLSQGENPLLSPTAAGWIFGVPLLDTIAVIVRRVTASKSPFSPSRDHLHHKLLDKGYTVNQTVLCMVSLHSVFVCLGLMVNSRPQAEFGMFWLFVVLVITHFLVTPLLLNNRAKIGDNQTNKPK